MINPTAKIIESEFSAIPLENIFNTGLYPQNLSEFMSKPSWSEELEIGLDHESEIGIYIIYISDSKFLKISDF